MNKKHIYSLTSLRFFAAAGVFLHHLGVLKTVDDKLVNEAARYFFSGYAGVTFFIFCQDLSYHLVIANIKKMVFLIQKILFFLEFAEYFLYIY